ncbi:unnamed protein product [Cuscuta campestris]|uniref:Uncharacterized protein n=1 Tax=Cuscuta campestris TaxID=132261 RepID=A0A484NT90_9ASTE|nr:unnamed protein product [Cuscuta campestris]
MYSADKTTEKSTSSSPLNPPHLAFSAISNAVGSKGELLYAVLGLVVINDDQLWILANILHFPIRLHLKNLGLKWKLMNLERTADKFKEEFTKSESPPKKSRVEIKADEIEETNNKFKEEFTKSEGFDIQTFPGNYKCHVGVLKVEFDLKYLYTLLYYIFGCIFSLNYAISKENEKQNKSITLEKVIKSNYRSSDVFLTTFLAKYQNTGESKIYQAEVWFCSDDGEIEVSILREREREQGETTAAWTILLED